jgi:hypothetical protein
VVFILKTKITDELWISCLTVQLISPDIIEFRQHVPEHTSFFLPGRGFCSGYLSHPRTEQKWYTKWNSKSSETSGRGHREAGGLHRRNVKRYCLK